MIRLLAALACLLLVMFRGDWDTHLVGSFLRVLVSFSD